MNARELKQDAKKYSKTLNDQLYSDKWKSIIKNMRIIFKGLRSSGDNDVIYIDFKSKKVTKRV